jgi:hypothetical protein
MSSAKQEADMMQAVVRRFSQWFDRAQPSGAPTAQEADLPRDVPVPAPQPVGLEETAPIDVEDTAPIDMEAVLSGRA